jgi:fermentation-respiration switch protein FrsA (DUF1100 family)
MNLRPPDIRLPRSRFGASPSAPASRSAWRPSDPLVVWCWKAPFTSAVDVAARRYPLVPVWWLMKDQFRSDLRIGSVAAPLLVLHGAGDTVVPIEYGQRLFRLAREPKRFVGYPDGEHEGLDQLGALATVRAFLGERFD